jgi:hypothetical protein
MSAKFCGYGTVYRGEGAGFGDGSAVMLKDGKECASQDSVMLYESEKEGSDKGSGIQHIA